MCLGYVCFVVCGSVLLCGVLKTCIIVFVLLSLLLLISCVVVFVVSVYIYRVY